MTASNQSKQFEAAVAAWHKGRERYASKLQAQSTLSGLPIKTVYTPVSYTHLTLPTNREV